MEKINTEIVISSLISMGFDKIDTLLYTYTLAKTSMLNDKLKLFKYEDEEYSEVFNKNVDYTTPIITLKEGASSEELNINTNLINILETIDYKEVVMAKFKMLYELGQLDLFNDYFSKREKEILYTEFNVEIKPIPKKVKTK